MDFMKVIDQTVREIKREVNLKVLKIPELEQKVLDATDDQPWGPHGSDLAEIAQCSKKFTDCQLIMSVLWTRLQETGKNWRCPYKALLVIEFLVAHGSERAVDKIIEHSFHISTLSSFEYVESNGKDLGLNVRKKAESIMSLLNDKDKIQEARQKAAANHAKYIGLSSTGLSLKSHSNSLAAGRSNCLGTHDGHSDVMAGSKFKDNQGENVQQRPRDTETSNKAHHQNSKCNRKDFEGKGQTVEVFNGLTIPVVRSVSEENKYDLDNDFDPRGSCISKPSAHFPKELDLMDAQSQVLSNELGTTTNSLQADLFADSLFTSAPLKDEKDAGSLYQGIPIIEPNDTAAPATIDLFSASGLAQPSEAEKVIADPFHDVPSIQSEASDLFGEFTSNPDMISGDPAQCCKRQEIAKDCEATHSTNPRVPENKKTFRVKSGVWADSLSRGLIDLDISAPKKESLTKMGVVGDLTGKQRVQGSINYAN